MSVRQATLNTCGQAKISIAAVVQRPGEEEEHGEQRRQGQGEHHAARVVPGLVRDAGLIALGRDQQPAEEVERHRPALADQRGDGERDPHGGRAEAAPRREAGRDPAGRSGPPGRGGAARRRRADASAWRGGRPSRARRRALAAARASRGRAGACQGQDLVLASRGRASAGRRSSPARPVLEPERRPRRFVRFLHAIHHHPPNPVPVSGLSPDIVLAPLRVGPPGVRVGPGLIPIPGRARGRRLMP